MDFSDVYGRPLFDTREWKTVVEQGNPISNPLFMVLLVISVSTQNLLLPVYLVNMTHSLDARRFFRCKAILYWVSRFQARFQGSVASVFSHTRPPLCIVYMKLLRIMPAHFRVDGVYFVGCFLAPTGLENPRSHI